MLIYFNGVTQIHDSLFIDAHGVNNGHGFEYDIEGYFIYDKIDEFKEGKKGISQIKRKHSLSKEIIPINNPAIKSKHKLLVDKKIVNDNLTETTLCYIFPHKYGLTRLLFLKTYLERNEQLENIFVNSFISDSIPKYVKNSAIIDTINFVGRDIILGPACEWKGPHNISCGEKGQMSWTIFRNEKQAKNYIKVRKQITQDKWLGNVLSEKNITLLFEGKQVEAIKMTIKLKVPKAIMGGSNTLIIYYVYAEVRSRYISCILSHYSNDTENDYLPQLLTEVLTLVD